MDKKIHIAVTADDGGINTSFHFKDATVEQLALINGELDILKLEIIERLRDAPKEYEIKDYGEDQEP